MRGRRSGLALTPDLCLSILQKVSNLPRQTLKLLLKLGLNHALQLRKMKEEQTERHENVHIICSIYTKCHLSLIFFITYFSMPAKAVPQIYIVQRFHWWQEFDVLYTCTCSDGMLLFL